MSLRKALRRDMERYREHGGWYRHLGFYVGAAHRLGARAREVRSPIRYPLLAMYKAAVLPFQIVRKCEIPSRAQLGAGLYLPSPFDIVMPHTCTIGEGCTLHAGVTLGRGPVPGVPQLGRNVTLMPGSKVLGGVRIGDGVVVEANAVVTKDVTHGVVVSSPVPRIGPRGGVPSA